MGSSRSLLRRASVLFLLACVGVALIDKIDPAFCVRLPFTESVPTLVRLPGAIVPLFVTSPAIVPVPPNVAPLATVVAEVVDPLTNSVPELTLVTPV